MEDMAWNDLEGIVLVVADDEEYLDTGRGL